MLNCLAAAIPGGDRIVSAEEVFELERLSNQRNVIGLVGGQERLPHLVQGCRAIFRGSNRRYGSTADPRGNRPEQDDHATDQQGGTD
jgi:hypothetical protein